MDYLLEVSGGNYKPPGGMRGLRRSGAGKDEKIYYFECPLDD